MTKTGLLPLLLSLCFGSMSARGADLPDPAASQVQPGSVTTPSPEAPVEERDGTSEQADADDPQRSPSVSDEIVVTATRSPRALGDLPASVAVINREAIRSAPVRAVDDLIREIPGVVPSIVSSSGSTPNNQRFSMRGLGGTRALVMVDGIPLHDPYSGIVQWQNIPLQSLRQIEVVRGGNASLFGNYALGGTVNLLTRPIVANDLAVDVSYGSWDTGRASAELDYVINDVAALRLSHYQIDSDGYYRVPDPGPVDIPAWVDNAITSARADLRFSDRANAFVNVGTSRIDISQGRPLAFSKRDIDIISAGYNHAVGESGLISARAYTQNQSEHLVNSRIVGGGTSEYKTQDGTIDSTGSGASVEWTAQAGARFPLFSLGLDLQQLESTENRASFSRNGDVTERVRVAGRQTFAGAFAQLSWRPTGRLEILSSARIDWFRNDQGSETIVDGESTIYPSATSRQFDPRISLRYASSARSAIRASVYRAFNAPTLRDLYRNTESGNSILIGNPDLEPETLVGGEVGWEWANDDTRIEVTVYRSTIDGLQSRAALDASSTIFQNKNLGTVRSQGIEITTDVRISRRWQARAAYTFADSTITEDPNPNLIGNWSAEVPRHSGSLSVRFTGDRGTRLEVRGRAVGLSYGDIENLSPQPAHQILDLSMSHPLRGGLDVYLIAENVFDEVYYQALSPTSFRSGLPRTITGGIRFDTVRWRSR